MATSHHDKSSAPRMTSSEAERFYRGIVSGELDLRDTRHGDLRKEQRGITTTDIVGMLPHAVVVEHSWDETHSNWRFVVSGPSASKRWLTVVLGLSDAPLRVWLVTAYWQIARPPRRKSNEEIR